MKQRDDECFGDGMDDGLDTDFDFEGNLALFDKAAVFSEIDTSERRGNGARSRGTPQEQTPSRYRHDENILEAKPIVYRQIAVPQPETKEYCTGKCFTRLGEELYLCDYETNRTEDFEANRKCCIIFLFLPVIQCRLWAHRTQYIL